MAIQASATTPANNGVAVKGLKDFLVASGAWVVTHSGDGLSAYATSDVLSSATSGANGIANEFAWFTIRPSDSSVYFQFIRGADDVTWTAKRSRTAFSGGTPNATTPGTSAEAVTLCNNATLFPASIGNWFIALDDAAPFFFHAFNVPINGGNVNTQIYHEPLRSGSYPATGNADADPALACASYSGGWDITTNIPYSSGGGSPVVYKRFLHGLAGAANIRVGFHTEYVDGNLVQPPQGSGAAQVGVEPYNDREVGDLIRVSKPGNNSDGTGKVGETSSIRWASVYGRANGDTLNCTTEYYIFVGGQWWRWNSTTPPV